MVYTTHVYKHVHKYTHTQTLHIQSKPLVTVYTVMTNQEDVGTYRQVVIGMTIMPVIYLPGNGVGNKRPLKSHAIKA